MATLWHRDTLASTHTCMRIVRPTRSEGEDRWALRIQRERERESFVMVGKIPILELGNVQSSSENLRRWTADRANCQPDRTGELEQWTVWLECVMQVASWRTMLFWATESVALWSQRLVIWLDTGSSDWSDLPSRKGHKPQGVRITAH